MADVIIPLATLRSILHDLNGEMFVVRGHAELGQSKAEPDSEQARHFDAILERSDAMMEIISRLRSFRDEAIEIEQSNSQSNDQA